MRAPRSGLGKAQRLAAGAELRQASTTNRLTREQITALITEAGEIGATLNSADPGAMADACSKLGIRLTYDPGRSVVHAAARPQPGLIGKWFVSEGRLHPKPNAL
jgi:hypothetical protein